MSKSLEILEKYWGHREFRPLQEDIIDSVIYGHDTLALLPTGGGKSICFQIPGLIREGVCVVISPLIALMEDQVKNLRQKGIQAACIVSGMSNKEVDIILDNVRFGKIKFLYTSPERLKSRLFIERFKLMNVGLIAVDEAHCISQWGFDFRPAFLSIAELRVLQPSVPIIALTATATEQVKQDIVEKLTLKNNNYFEGSFERSNLSYEVKTINNKEKNILDFIQKQGRNSGIIYCQTRKSTKNIAKLLISQGISATFYHGGLIKTERSQKQKDWIENRYAVIVATNAFGMGIDKPDVRFVLHYEFPDSLEAFYQEAGRAGRDGEFAKTIAFIEANDFEKIEEKVIQRFPEIETIKLIYRALCNHLKIAIGSGKEESYDFDLTVFKEKYDFDLIEIYHSLKILELNGTLVFSENSFRQTRLKYAVGNMPLYNFQLQNEKLDPLISIISRTYTGVFDQYVEINEREISKRLSISMAELKKQLSFLEKNGIIEISWNSDSPQVTFINERLPDDYLRIAPEVLKIRKQVALEKLVAVKKYLNEPICRSVQLLNYFGQEGNPCGNCDVCKQKKTLTEQELSIQLHNMLEKQACSFDELVDVLGEESKIKINAILNLWFDRKTIALDNQQKIRLR